MPEFQDCRDQIRVLLAGGFIDQAAQRASLAIDAAGAPPAATTAAVHFVGLAVRYASQGDQAAALEAFDTVLDTLAHSAEGATDLRPRLYQNVATALAAAGAHAGAAECLESAIELGADDATVWKALGVARLRAGRSLDALKALERARRLRPSPAVTAEVALATLALDPSAGSAREVLALLATSRPDSTPVRWDFALARASELAGDRDAAAAAYRRALEHADGELIDAERQLARAFLQRDR